MTSIEKARKIIEQNGECHGFMCHDINGGDEICPCYMENGEVHKCLKGIKSKIEYAKKWLSEHEEKEIIGWPGNADEMRQYIGRKCAFKMEWSDDWSIELVLTDIRGKDIPYISTDKASWWRYIKVLPEEPKPTVKEYTIQEIADKLGVPVETIRIKDK